MRDMIAVAKTACLAALLALAASSARADLVLERTVREFGPKPAEKAAAPADAAKPAPEARPEIVELSVRHYTVKMAPGKLRETSEDGMSAVILRSDLELLWLLEIDKDKKTKTYREVSFKSLNAAANTGRERLRRRLPMIDDPEARTRIEVMLDNDPDAPPVTVKRPGTKKRIAEEDCELVVVSAGPQEILRAFLSTRAAPALEQPWIGAGGLLGGKLAEALAGLKGIVMEATLPLPGGGRIEITTGPLSEAREEPGDYDDPAKSGYARVGSAERAPERKPDEKAPEEKKPAGTSSPRKTKSPQPPK
jgi:hypothetical protein